MSDYGCLPVSPANGVCLANDSDAVKNLTDMAQISNNNLLLSMVFLLSLLDFNSSLLLN